MTVLRWLVSGWNIFVVMFIYFCSRGLKWETDRSTIVGFVAMSIMYVLATLLIWG